MTALVSIKNQGLNSDYTRFYSNMTISFSTDTAVTSTVYTPSGVVTASEITTASFNDIFDAVYEVIGIGENGYGLQDFYSNPISSNTVIRGRDWNNLQKDVVQIAYQHVTGSSSTWSLASISTGSVITTSTHNEGWDAVQYVVQNRYTCHESMYYRDPVTAASTNTTGGSSSRTIEWGVTQNYIEHKVRARWPSRLLARYFFNSGGYWTWTPYHSNNVLNDIDLAWAQFIVNIQNDQALDLHPLKYDRAAFEAQSPGTTATIYPVGSALVYPAPTYSDPNGLTVNVSVYKASNEQYLEFTIRFTSNNSPNLVITPSVAYWNVIV